MSQTESLEELVDNCHIETTQVTLQGSASTPISTIFAFTGNGKTRRAKSNAICRFSTNIEERKRKKQHYLIPIGSVKETGSPYQMPRWVDVASIINQGTDTHKNIDLLKARENEHLMTLSSGTLTSVLTKLKSYSVLPVKNPMLTLEELMQFHANINAKVFQETHAKFVCANIMMALRFLHEHKIFHGSICPRKIVFNEKGYPCLTGFGTADIIDDRQSRPRERTQFEYTSPEQMYWEYITEATDIYSTGCVIYAFLYGRPPHQGSDTLATRRNMNDKHFVVEFPRDTLSRQGKKFISKCIRKRESRRYSILETKNMFEDISWFSGLNEDKLYKQVIPSPLLSAIQKTSSAKSEI
ncbi:putative 3-phosphoinositide-dependent protein kinase 2 [Mercenaria mercenaria]|uniref:putative 3-phosphoinositide-dependent protein kinase 2 n=1 Tax=Mercenaria mercenaria TaxID=6596 RepID=UPI001E1DD3BE|nr:putative 3-phosphoinositide-dependent protein kinase 2 [Mercenaria mercenaria]